MGNDFASKSPDVGFEAPLEWWKDGDVVALRNPDDGRLSCLSHNELGRQK